MDNVKSKKLTALISKLTIAANKAVAKKAAQAHEPRKHYSITGLNVNANYNQRGTFGQVNFLRSQL